jgi:hypothetical protein
MRWLLRWDCRLMRSWACFNGKAATMTQGPGCTQSLTMSDGQLTHLLSIRHVCDIQQVCQAGVAAQG